MKKLTPNSKTPVKEKTDDSDDRAGLFIPGGLFIGLGIGFFLDQLVGGMFIGLGAGFLMMAMAKILKW